MENDTIRSIGGNTLVDIWVDGRMRAISVSREAIESYFGLRADQAPDSDGARCEFVRTHLSVILKAARKRLRECDPSIATIVLAATDLGEGPSGAERRKTDRRRTERRKSDRPEAVPPSGDRRRAQRRKTDRRSRAKPPATSA